MSVSLKNAIRDIPDFPKPGILFKDITPVLAQPELFQEAIDLLADSLKSQSVDKIAGIDARGFLFGAPLALALGVGFVPIRKQGKLPAECYSESYALEYGENVIEMHKDALNTGERVALVDDLLATGGTAAASLSLLQSAGADVVGVRFFIELTALNGRKNLHDNNVKSILTY